MIHCDRPPVGEGARPLTALGIRRVSRGMFDSMPERRKPRRMALVDVIVTTPERSVDKVQPEYSPQMIDELWEQGLAWETHLCPATPGLKR